MDRTVRTISKSAHPCRYHAKHVPYKLGRGLRIDALAVTKEVREVPREKWTDYASKICACVLSKQTAEGMCMRSVHAVAERRGKSKGCATAQSRLEYECYCRTTFAPLTLVHACVLFASSPGVVKGLHDVLGHEGGIDQVPQPARSALNHEVLERKYLCWQRAETRIQQLKSPM